ncbi:btk-binding protein-related [Anaeramoeba flamelloides]|uniref:Btk-binding protein-related n=1 Tax=Anaeramoeba flamelloides TaxID=1746091 RepID=A0AAV7ZQA5_9EUKA|nr:btk-binding protein-related [Anaeramoeba flamelloides]
MSNIKGIGSNTGHWTRGNSTNQQKLQLLTIFPEEVINIRDVVADYKNNILFLSEEGRIYQTKPSTFQPKLKPIANIPRIKSIASGHYHFLALSNEEKPKAYGWGITNHGELGGTQRQLDFTLIPGLNDIHIDKIYASGYSSFFLNTQNHILYGCGKNSKGELGLPSKELRQSQILKLHENVLKVFSGHGIHSFILKTDGELYAFGHNTKGQYGNGTTETKFQPTKMKYQFQTSKISKIVSAYQHTTILTIDGKVYVTGLDVYNGFGSNLLEFRQYPQFKDKIIIKDIACGYFFISFLTEENEIWVTGRSRFGTNNSNGRNLRKVYTFDVENELPFNTIRCLDIDVLFLLHLNKDNYLSQDLGIILEKGFFSDCKIQKIPVHKFLIQTRLRKPFDEVKKYLEENCTIMEIKALLKWIYTEKFKNRKKIFEILNYFGIQDPQKNKSLKSDLKKLLFDEETSDFTLIVQNDEGDEDDEDGELFEEIHVHKFILVARSGLFRDMFLNLNQNLKNVKDYSGKSLESIELLITFLYTDEIPITADTDQEFIREEFEDMVEFYQLNPKIPLLEIFDKCSKK